MSSDWQRPYSGSPAPSRTSESDVRQATRRPDVRTAPAARRWRSRPRRPAARRNARSPAPASLPGWSEVDRGLGARAAPPRSSRCRLASRWLTSSSTDGPGPTLNRPSATGESWKAAVKRCRARYSSSAVRDSARVALAQLEREPLVVDRDRDRGGDRPAARRGPRGRSARPSWRPTTIAPSAREPDSSTGTASSDLRPVLTALPGLTVDAPRVELLRSAGDQHAAADVEHGEHAPAGQLRGLADELREPGVAIGVRVTRGHRGPVPGALRSADRSTQPAPNVRRSAW